MTKRTIAFHLLSFIFCLSALAQPMHVAGKIEGLKKGTLHMLVRKSETRVDTLATVAFKKGKFALEADIAEPMVAQLMIDGYDGGFTFIAEPGATYEALLRNSEGAYIRGGNLHAQWQQFIQEDAERRAVAQAIEARYEALRRERKFRSASLANDSLKQAKALIAQETDRFLHSHDDIIAAHTYQSHAAQSDAPLSVSRQMYNSMGPVAKASLSGRLMLERIQRVARSAKGQPAPDFTLRTPEGKDVTLSQVPGKLKIVDFWASWCGPCRLNNPHLRALYEKYHALGLEVVGVSLDSNAAAWQAAIDKDALPWINVSSLQGNRCEVARTYNVSAIPSVFVLNEANQIIASNLRGEALENFLKDFFGE